METKKMESSLEDRQAIRKLIEVSRQLGLDTREAIIIGGMNLARSRPFFDKALEKIEGMIYPEHTNLREGTSVFLHAIDYNQTLGHELLNAAGIIKVTQGMTERRILSMVENDPSLILDMDRFKKIKQGIEEKMLAQFDLTAVKTLTKQLEAVSKKLESPELKN